MDWLVFNKRLENGAFRQVRGAMCVGIMRWITGFGWWGRFLAPKRGKYELTEYGRVVVEVF
jgi:hypothetical protein